MSNTKKKAENSSKQKKGGNTGLTYNPMVQSLLDIWNVLASSTGPLTAKEIGNRLSRNNKDTSPSTAARRLNDSVDLINTIFPQTVLHEEGTDPILHTYPYKNALHVVVENTFGKPLWEGEMSAVFQESAVNPVPQPTLNRKLPEMVQTFDEMAKATKKKQAQSESGKQAPKDPRAEENMKFEEDYPPLSLAAIIETTNQNKKKVVLSSQEYTKWQETLPEEEQNSKTPTRKYYLKSILSPEEWQILSDTILVYPYISEKETDKLMSAMARMAPGMRKWNKLVHAKKTPNAVRFDFIRTLEDAIQNQCKVSIQYGRYFLEYKLGGWKPVLRADGKPHYVTHPYALTWSNGYYYLVCSIEKKDENGAITQEMRNFRVDRILDIKTPRTIIPFEKPANFDVYRYRDQSPVMYPGEAVPIKLRCHISMLSILMDFFGTAISKYSDPLDETGSPVVQIDEGANISHITVTLNASESGTKLFALQYVDRVEVLEPKSLREEISATLRTAVMDYM